MELLAQLHDRPLPLQPALYWEMLVVWGVLGVVSSLYLLFWLWMLIQCLRSEPDWQFWLWLLVIAPFPGAIVYAAMRYYPAMDAGTPSFLRRWTRGRELARLETAAEQIGNPHQFIQWGDALREVGQWSAARAAYDRALHKEPDNLPALWGAALVAQQQQRFADAADFTQRIMAKDPQYKFGDVSLAYGVALMEQGQSAAARAHFETHIKRWRHPEGLYRLACLCRDGGDPASAQQYARSLLQDLNVSPTAIARKYGRWRSRAKQLLRQLSRSTG